MTECERNIVNDVISILKQAQDGETEEIFLDAWGSQRVINRLSTLLSFCTLSSMFDIIGLRFYHDATETRWAYEMAQISYNIEKRG